MFITEVSQSHKITAWTETKVNRFLRSNKIRIICIFSYSGEYNKISGQGTDCQSAPAGGYARDARHTFVSVRKGASDGWQQNVWKQKGASDARQQNVWKQKLASDAWQQNVWKQKLASDARQQNVWKQKLASDARQQNVCEQNPLGDGWQQNVGRQKLADDGWEHNVGEQKLASGPRGALWINKLPTITDAALQNMPCW
ncbi:hypothetical protein [uncultured Sunxiuqinia sp.]|uniref:hypothetical protein n=1 Tax=uncultured Sunxiuqinia sp. TaxID=1573825 RepID=UPI00262BC5B5|nr:hypothetical protein [uncultured Sunxiuqinia sp.]